MSPNDYGSRRGADFNDSRCSTPGLLVSVRSLPEARAISNLSFDVLDLKEPRHGPLGACDPALWRACLEQVPFSGQWSVALGEPAIACGLAKHVPEGVHFAKPGTSGLASETRLARLWHDVRRPLRPSVALVAVAYADHKQAGGLAPEAILRLAAATQIPTLLIDTFGKTGCSSMETLGKNRLADLVAGAAEMGCDVVLAGGMRLATLADAIATGVCRVGVRGGVCRGGRTGTIDTEILRSWIEFLRAAVTSGEDELKSVR